MKERPIIFSGPMVRALLADVKTQTRRVAKFKVDKGLNRAFSGLSADLYSTGDPDQGWCLYSRGSGGAWNARTAPLRCPYGLVGDRLWVKETWYDDMPGVGANGARQRVEGGVEGVEFRATHRCTNFEAGCPCNPDGDGKRSEWRTPLFMPRWASRLTLELRSVRVERVQAITEEDARAEGFGVAFGPGHFSRAFDSYWDEINGERAPWSSNPWVWVLRFKRVEASR